MDRARDAYQHNFRSRGYSGGTQRQATQLERGGYPTRHQAIPDKQNVDGVLRNMEDDTWSLEGECAYADEGEGKVYDSEDEEGSEEELNEEEEEAADLAALDEIGGHGDTEDVRSSGYDDVEDVRSCGEIPIIGCATKADALTESQTLIGVFEMAMAFLKEVGAQGAIAQLENETHKGKRRLCQQREPIRIARVGTAKGLRDGLGAKSETHVAR